jgi:hypothetical protein
MKSSGSVEATSDFNILAPRLTSFPFLYTAR